MTGNCIRDAVSRLGRGNYCVLDGKRRRGRPGTGMKAQQNDLDDAQEMERGR